MARIPFESPDATQGRTALQREEFPLRGYKPDTATVIGANLAEVYTGAGSGWQDIRAYKAKVQSGESVLSPDESELSPVLEEEEWKKGPYYRPGLSYEPNLREAVARIRSERYDERERRNFVMSRASTAQNVVGVGAGFVGGVFEPKNFLAAVTTPVFPQAGVAALTARFGKLGARAIRGGVEGAVGAVALEPTAISSARRLQDDYTMTDSLFNVAASSVFGAGLHSVGGAVADRLRANRARTNMDALETSVNQLMEGRNINVEPVLNADPAYRAGLTEPQALPRSQRPVEVQRNESGNIVRRISTVTGREIDVEEIVVEADTLVTSQLPGGRRNPSYPAELQPRDRTRAVSEQQINTIAANIRPDELIVSAKASDGPPVISQDNVVESGNGRSLAVRKAYVQGKGEGYRKRLQELGYNVEGMRQPILVRRRLQPLDSEETIAFTREANEKDTLSFSASERAKADAENLGENLVSMYKGGDVDAAANRDFVRAFSDAVVKGGDSGAFMDAKGRISQAGIKRVQNAIFAKTYNDEVLLNFLMESTDNNIRNIGGAMLDAAPRWAQMRQNAASSVIDPEMDITNNLIQAANMVRESRAGKGNLADMVNQIDAFNGTIDPNTKGILDLMYRDNVNYTKPVGRERLYKALDYYVNQASLAKNAEAQLFSDLPRVTPRQVLDMARKRHTIGDSLETTNLYGGSVNEQALRQELVNAVEKQNSVESINAIDLEASRDADVFLERRPDSDDLSVVENDISELEKDIANLREQGALTEDMQADLEEVNNLAADADSRAAQTVSLANCLARSR